MTTHCKRLIDYLQHEIEYKGLQQISGTIFSKHPIRRVLEAKQFETKMYDNPMNPKKVKFVSKALIAKDLYNMMTAEAILVIGECSICSKFLLEGRDENHVCSEEKNTRE